MCVEREEQLNDLLRGKEIYLSTKGGDDLRHKEDVLAKK